MNIREKVLIVEDEKGISQFVLPGKRGERPGLCRGKGGFS